MMTQENTCCFTGHRIISRGEQERLKAEVLIKMEQLAEQGVNHFISGCALGFDTIAALQVLKLRERYPLVTLTAVLPCVGQEQRWSPGEQEVYHQILGQSDRCIVLSEAYYTGCMHERNRYMVNHSACVLAYLVQNKGGTKYTVEYAMKKNKNIIFL